MKHLVIQILIFGLVAVTMGLIAPTGYAGEPFLSAHFPLVLADTPPSNWWEMIGAALLGAVIVWVVNYFLPDKTGKIRVTGQPVHVTISQELHKQFVSKEDFGEWKIKLGDLDLELSEIRKEGENRKDDLMRQISERAKDVHTRIDKLAEEMPQRIITLLLTTGALKK